MKIEYVIPNYKASAAFRVSIDCNRLASITCLSIDGALPAAPRVIGGGKERPMEAGDTIHLRAQEAETEIGVAARALQLGRYNLRATA